MPPVGGLSKARAVAVSEKSRQAGEPTAGHPAGFVGATYAEWDSRRPSGQSSARADFRYFSGWADRGAKPTSATSRTIVRWGQEKLRKMIWGTAGPTWRGVETPRGGPVHSAASTARGWEIVEEKRKSRFNHRGTEDHREERNLEKH